MKLTIYNYTPESIMHLLKKFEKLHSNELLSPITLDFSYLHIEEPNGNNKLQINLYDYFDNENNFAEIDLEDASLKFDNIQLTKYYIIIDNKKYKYKSY